MSGAGGGVGWDGERACAWLSGECSGSEPVTRDLERAFSEMRDREGSRSRWNRSGVTYVAGGLLLRGSVHEPDVLLVQESKASCAGKWYLPMGRVEVGEELVEGAAREVKEESGFEVAVGPLITASTSKSTWHRFIFACTVSADAESMCAEWWALKTVLEERIPMRGHTEIFRTLRIGWELYQRAGGEEGWMTAVGSPTPLETSPSLIYRLLLARKGEREVLVSGDGTLPSVAIPLAVYKPRYYVVQKIRALLGENGEAQVRPPVTVSIRSHLGPSSRYSGLAITLLFRLRDPTSPATAPSPTAGRSRRTPSPPPPFAWQPMPSTAVTNLALLATHAAPYYFK